MCAHNETDVLLDRWQRSEYCRRKLLAAIRKHRQAIYGEAAVDFEPDEELYQIVEAEEAEAKAVTEAPGD